LRRNELGQIIADLGHASYTSQVFRHVAPAFDCESAEGARITGGRWNPPASFPALYTATSKETVAAELRRLANQQLRPVEDFLPRRLCVMEVSLAAVVDLRSNEALASVGLTPANVIDRDPSNCRTVGKGVHDLGLEGILVPSATTVGTVLVIYPTNLYPSSSVVTVATEGWTQGQDLPGELEPG
jgi:RES domain-containing protein